LSGVRRRLEEVLRGMPAVSVAVSGGVDSLTLASLARHVLGDRMRAVHAISPAVPAEATARVRALATADGWSLRVIEAGEFDDERYRANPVNRCFYCKTNLYGAIATVCDGLIVSGANVDDLGEYRPGLDAAADHGVRHPYVEAGVDKATVRALARSLGLPDIADLPAQPCLSSRVETGLRIEPALLAFIHDVERAVGEALPAPPTRTIRCRVRAAGVVVELDAASLAACDGERRRVLLAAIDDLTPDELAGRPVAFAPYRVGSAFLHRPAEALA
jgi:pyridinium-3,5-biscarboxylic acid mononucleotide sulfurtransferase